MPNAVSENQLVFIHLSDIHFHRERNSMFDIDSGLRNELVLDVNEIARELGHVNGVLISGDIAFSGKISEYDDASTWIARLCDQAGCPAENVWVVPGNHDVDRATIQASAIIQNIHSDLRPKDSAYVDAGLKKWLSDPQAKDLMFSPIENYNTFAQRFGCQSNSSEVYWQQELKLNDGSSLRIRGINSALASGPTDNQEDRKLVVGGFQSNLLREPGVAYLVMCHHPADWILDADNMIDGLDANAAIQLFGHKHRQRFQEVGNKGVRIVAGAVQPTRSEVGWQPRYNILAIDVETDNDNRNLRLMAWPRLWRDDLRRFTADAETDGAIFRTFKLALGSWKGPIASRKELSSQQQINVDTNTQAPADYTVPEQNGHQAVMNAEEGRFVDIERRLMYRFFGLSYAQIVKIAARLDLLSDEDAGAKDAERFQRFYKRARERQQLAELWSLVEERYDDNENQQNPFTELAEAEV